MSLLKYWPTEADCLECITPEAENPSDAVFLAVHQEMRFYRESFQNRGKKEAKSQQQLLNEFLRDEPSGRVILPILGEAGVGKSHLIRWLKVQLQQRADRDKRHVILIPKSSSLKSVLGRILDGLEGPRYGEIRNKLQAAREQMDDIGAKQRIRAELLAAIERKFDEACEQRQKARALGIKLEPKYEEWYGHGAPNKLPALFGDPATQDLFLKGTTVRPGIISELARHIKQDTIRDSSPRRQFEKEDFYVPQELEDEVSKAGTHAYTYLRKNLLKETSSKSLEQAVRLLNTVIDDAIAPLATPTDTSLAELFYEVRRQLLADGLELVLLVEDFAVLAGVQRALLDAIRREGRVSGRAEACTIRTALAVTEGYFFDANLDTVLSRAVHGWWVETGEGEVEDDVTNQIGNFVAAYLNAARIGAKRLEEHYAKPSSIGKKAPNAMDFLDPEPDELALLASFGQSVDSYSLFPFNRTAICTIADWRLRDQQGRLKYHPRNVINEIILPVIKDARGSFERGVFPPENFLGFLRTRISSDLSTEVSRKESDPYRQEQYLYLLHFWAGQPEKLSEASLPVGVYESFGLSLLHGSKTAVEPEPLKRLSIDYVKADEDNEKKQKLEPVAEREPLEIRQFVEKINEWRGGVVLGQVEANRIRGWMNTHIMHSINWEAEMLRSIKPTTNTFATSIYLPRAKGNPPNLEKAFITVASDERFSDAKVANDVFLAIRAMLRYDHHKGWDYEQSDEDYIAISNFVDVHLQNAATWIRTKYKNVDGTPVPSLTQSLLWQARILNIEKAQKSDDASHIDALFAEIPEHVTINDDHEWHEFTTSLKAHRKLLKQELLERVSAVQGAWKENQEKFHAIDASQLLDVIQAFRKTWEITETFPPMPTSVSDELKAIDRHINLLNRFGKARVEARRKRIAEQSKFIVAELGNDYDKIELVKDLEEVCSLSEQYGLKGEITVGQLRSVIEKFKEARAKEVSEQVEAIVSGDDLATRMTAIAKLDIETHALLVEFSQTCAQFLRERAGKAQNKILSWSANVVEKKKLDVDEILKTLEEAVVPYQKVDA
jgi:hypothetical protein